MAAISRKRFLQLSAVALAGGVLAACTVGDDSAPSVRTPQRGTGAPEGSFPRTVEHAFGRTTINEEPQRIVTVGWANAEVLAAFDVIPAAMGPVLWGGNQDRLNDWFTTKVEELQAPQPYLFDEEKGINFQQIREQNPDLIVNVLGIMSEEDYAALSEIAPVCTFREGGENWNSSWEEATIVVGQAIGREDDAKKLVARLKAKLEQVTKDNTQLAKKSLAVTSLRPSGEQKIGVYSPKDARFALFQHMGFSVPNSVRDLNFPDGSFFTAVQASKAESLKSDLLYTWVENEDAVEQIKKDKDLSKIPAVKAGAMVAETSKKRANAMGTSPLAIEWLLEESGFVEDLVKALPQEKSSSSRPTSSSTSSTATSSSSAATSSSTSTSATNSTSGAATTSQ